MPAIAVQCACLTAAPPADFAAAVAAFYQMREQCAALRLAIPDDIVARHRAFALSSLDDANHASVPLLSYRRGRLAEFSGPIHGVILDSASLRVDVTRQYLQDLRETWIFQDDSISRFRQARHFLARVMELQFVHWLQDKGWRITQLEAYGGQFDVEAQSPDGVAVTFEIKFLAQREVVFELNRASFSVPTASYPGVYSPIDYLIFRVYEAAKKLSSSANRRIAVAIVSDYQLSYEIPLSEKWVDWKHPRLLRRDSEIEKFLAEKHAANPKLDAELQISIGSLNEIWILRDGVAGLQLAHRFEVS